MTRTAAPSRPRQERRGGDLTLAGLAAGLVVWTALVPPGGPAAAGPALLTVVLATGSYAAGRLLSRSTELRSAVAVLLAGAPAAATLALGGTTGDALAPPLGYGNANGALLTVATGAALAAALGVRALPARLAGVAGAAVLVVLTHATASRAATALGAALVLVGLGLAVRPTLGRPLPALGALAALLALGATVAIAVTPSAGSGVQEALSDRRAVLWSEALDLTGSAPLKGTGHGGFAAGAPTAVADPDAAWAHSLWLHQAAETGVPGLLLLLGLAAVALLRVRADGWEDGGVPAIGVATTTALLVHASIDYVAHFPVVVAALALLAGLTLAPRRL